MVRRMLAGIVAMLVVGGIGQAAPVTDPGVIVVTGENLSGDWDFKGTVLVKSPADDPTIPDFFSGAFTVSGGDPTYSGSGTFNGLPATIEGVNATADPFTTTITLSNHITTGEGLSTFNGTLQSGDFVTGVFDGGTLDGLKSWQGTFSIQIIRPPTQTPAEQIESAFQVAQSEIVSIGTMASEGMSLIGAEARLAMIESASIPISRNIRTQSMRGLIQEKLLAGKTLEAVLSEFRTRTDQVIQTAPSASRSGLRSFVGKRLRDLNRTMANSRVLINESHHFAIEFIGSTFQLIRATILIAAKELNQIAAHLRVAAEEIRDPATGQTGGLGTIGLRAPFQRCADFFEAMAKKMQKEEALSAEEKECLKTLLVGKDNPDAEPGDDNPFFDGIFDDLRRRANGEEVAQNPSFIGLMIDKFAPEMHFSPLELQAMIDAFRKVFNDLDPKRAQKKLNALRTFAELFLSC